MASIHRFSDSVSQVCMNNNKDKESTDNSVDFAKPHGKTHDDKKAQTSDELDAESMPKTRGIAI